MAPQKQARRANYRTTRKGKHNRKRHYPKTARGHRQSTAGHIFPPLDVRSPKQLNEVMKRITNGPVTVLVVYADWCGHCHKLMPHVKNAGNMVNRNAQLISVNDEMLPRFNSTVNHSNRSTVPIEVDGYPSVLLIGQHGEKLSEIAPTEAALKSAMINVSPVAVEAGLSSNHSIIPNSKHSNVIPRNGSPEEVVEEIVENELIAPNKMPSKTSGPASFEHLSNDEIISEEPIEGEPVINNLSRTSLDVGVSPSINSIRFSTNANARRPSPSRVITATVPNEALSGTKSKNKESGDLSLREAEEITSLRAEPLAVPVSPDVRTDIRIKKEVKGGMIGGSHRGGCGLYGIMSQTAYRLAPAAVLLATAAAVMKKTRRNKRSGTKKLRRYRK